jgi:hypothetical protein
MQNIRITNLEIISISFDTDTNAWKKAIQQDNLHSLILKDFS